MPRTPKIELFTGLNGSCHYWRLVGGNGEIVCSSEPFVSRSNARRAAGRARTLFAVAEIVVVDK